MSIFDNMTLFDFETTGFSGEQDRVIEFAAIRIRNGRVVNTIAHVINPEVPLPEKITELTGITEQDLEGAPTMAQFLPWLMAFMGDGILVAHNAAFDLWFLEENNQCYRNKSVKNSFIDTLALCIDHFPFQKNQLEVVCERLGVPMVGAHRALNDVMGMWGVLQKLAELNGEAWIEERMNRLYYFKKYGPKEWYPAHAQVIEK